MDVQTLIHRALSGVGKGTKYESPGKMPSFTAASWPAGARNDCSGFVDWCLRFTESRKVDHPLYRKINGGWFETSAIYADGKEPTGFFRNLDSPQPGALLVYPDYRGADGKMHDGHIGVVVEVSGKGIEGATQVAHCSLGSYMNHGDAVQVTGPAPWVTHSQSIIVWFEGLDS